MDLLKAIRKEVLKQKEEEALNFFSSVADFREFIATAKPDADVSVTDKMTCLSSKRLNDDHGTRVTVIDANQRAFFDSTAEALAELTVVKQKSYIAQITVWDDKTNKVNKGFGGKPYMLFRRGAVYEFCKVDGVGFYADIAKGSVQYERVNSDKIVEVAGPVLKRKAPCAAGKMKAKARTESLNLSSDSDEEEDDIVMEAGNKDSDDDIGVRTRCNLPTPP